MELNRIRGWHIRSARGPRPPATAAHPTTISDSSAGSSIKQTTSEAGDIRAAKNLIKRHLEEDKDIEPKLKGYASIPKLFKFSFMSDANPDWHDELLAAGKSGNPGVAVNGFCVFFQPVDAKMEIPDHLEGIIGDFLPPFMREIEEQSFEIDSDAHGLDPEVRESQLASGELTALPFDRVAATLIAAGFSYDSSSCALAPLGGSGHAAAIARPAPPTGADIRFAVVRVKNITYHPSSRHSSEYIVSVAVDAGPAGSKALTRKALEKLVSTSLSAHKPCLPGRLMNGHLPQLELVQVIRKKSSITFVDESDAKKVFADLASLGWTHDPALASSEAAAKWTLEDWAVKPFPGQSTIQMENEDLWHSSEIEFHSWSPKEAPRPSHP